MKIEVGDILLMNSGRLLQVLEKRVENVYGLTMVQYIDENEYRMLDLEDPKKRVVRNFGKSEAVVASFHASRSIHLRLNKVTKI